MRFKLKNNKKPGVQRCIYLPKELDEKMKAYAVKHDLPISYIVRTALKNFIASKDDTY